MIDPPISQATHLRSLDFSFFSTKSYEIEDFAMATRETNDVARSSTTSGQGPRSKDKAPALTDCSTPQRYDRVPIER